MTALIRRLLLSSISVFLCLLTALPAGAVPYIVDGDGDRISDEIDDCPYTHPGVQVTAKGCPLRADDSDADGMPDEEDDCPYSPAGAVVDVRGCSLDADFDGVANGLDRCPRTALSLPVDAQGCAKNEVAEAVKATPKSLFAVAPAKKRSRPAKLEAEAVLAVAPVPSTPTPLVAARVTEPVDADRVQKSIAAVPTPVIAAIAAPVRAVAAEAPLMRVYFSENSSRIDAGEIASISRYAKVFARRLAADSAARVQLMAYADYREPDVAGIAAARIALVRNGLLAEGIAADRISTQSGVLRNGKASDNRRVEVTVSR